MILRRTSICSRCISRRPQRPIPFLRTLSGSAHAANSIYTKENPAPVSITPTNLDGIAAAFDSEPIWSVESLLPPKNTDNSGDAPEAPKVTPQQLHHLLRLSALPLPKSQEEEERMMSTLLDQLHFVGKIQQVDTNGVTPLRAIRDETSAAEREQTITLETLKNALAKEKVVGKHYKRIQRDTTPVDASDVENWSVLGSAERKQGKYFVVESERSQE